MKPKWKCNEKSEKNMQKYEYEYVDCTPFSYNL